MSTENVTAIAKREDPQLSRIRAQLDAGKKSLASVVPKYLTADRMVRLAMLAIGKQPKLRECTPLSILKSLMIASELGLEPGGGLGLGYLVPYYNGKAKTMECQFIAGYRGLAKLARNTGEIEIIEAHPVVKGDVFKVRRGTTNELIHEPNYEGGRSGEPFCYYALARYKTGAVQFEVMTREQILTIMAATQSKGEYGPWKDHFDEQARKTAIRRLSKSLPLDPEKSAALVKALEVSDERDEPDFVEGIEEDAPPPPETPNERAKAAVKRQATVKADAAAEYEEASALFQRLRGHSEEQAKQIWALMIPMPEKIDKLRAALREVEGGSMQQ